MGIKQEYVFLQEMIKTLSAQNVCKIVQIGRKASHTTDRTNPSSISLLHNIKMIAHALKLSPSFDGIT